MTPALSTEKASLEIHVLGGGQGESIVIRMPDGRWGVVDCFTTSPATSDCNPTALFLRARGVSQLQFVCLTHPHQDHFMGMVELMTEFNPREFWRFGSLSHEHVNNLVHYYEAKAIVKGRSEFTRSAEELLALFGKSLEGVQARTMNVEHATARATLYPPAAEEPAEYHIECLSPTGNQITLYESAIVRCLTPDGQLGERLTKTHHNNISVVLKISYGSTIIFLGGDLETAGWAEVAARYKDHMLNATAIKVSHHGSPNGYCPNLWARFATRAKPLAIVAPSNQHRLPKPDAVRHIKEHASALFSTCRPWDAVNVPGQATASNARSVKSRAALRGGMAAALAPSRPSSGCCSLVFDDSGNYQIETVEPAQQL